MGIQITIEPRRYLPCVLDEFERAVVFELLAGHERRLDAELIWVLGGRHPDPDMVRYQPSHLYLQLPASGFIETLVEGAPTLEEALGRSRTDLQARFPVLSDSLFNQLDAQHTVTIKLALGIPDLITYSNVPRKGAPPLLPLPQPGLYRLTQDVVNPKTDLRKRAMAVWHEREIFPQGLVVRVEPHRISRSDGIYSLPAKASQAQALIPHLVAFEIRSVSDANVAQDWYDGTAGEILQRLVDSGRVTLDEVIELGRQLHAIDKHEDVLDDKS